MKTNAYRRLNSYSYCFFVLIIISIVGIQFWEFLQPPLLTNNQPPALQHSNNSSHQVIITNHVQPSEPLPTDIPITLPSSLQQTTTDGMFTVDSNGHLIVSNSIKERFDYFLSILGEESLEQVVARITAHINQQLTSPAKEEAHDLLAQYLDYKVALVDYEQLLVSNMDSQAQQTQPLLTFFQQHRNALTQLRQQFFSPATVDAFFGFEQQYDEWVNQQLVINSYPSLSKKAKVDALTQLRDSLSPQLQTIFNPFKQERQLQSVIDQLTQQNATTEEIYAARTEVVGSEAADRLAKLDQDKAIWQQRINQFRQTYQTIHTSNLPEAEYLEAIKQLLDQQFTPQEQLRVKVLEQLPNSVVTPTY